MYDYVADLQRHKESVRNVAEKMTASNETAVWRPMDSDASSNQQRERGLERKMPAGMTYDESMYNGPRGRYTFSEWAASPPECDCGDSNTCVVCRTPGLTRASFWKLTSEYKRAFADGDRRDQEEWYKRRTADRVFAALGGLGLSGAVASSQTAPSVPSHKRKFDVSEVHALLRLDLESLLPGRAWRRDNRTRYRERTRTDFIEWTLSLSCVYAHGINERDNIPPYDLRNGEGGLLERIARAAIGPDKNYTAEENGSLAAFMTVMLMIKALEFAHQCFLVRDAKIYGQISSPFAIKPKGDFPLYKLLVEVAQSWRTRNLNPFSVIVARMDGAGRMLPAAVFSAVSRVADYALEYIPSMTQEEFAFLMKIPGMRVRVNDTDYSGDERKSDRPGEAQDPDVGSSILFYHLPRDDGNAKRLARSIVSVLNKLKVRELRAESDPAIRVESGPLSAYGGVPKWGGEPFLARYRERLAAYKARMQNERKGGSGGCTIL